MKIQLMWGLFPFSVDTIPHELFKLSTSYKYAENSRVGETNSLQYLGKNNDIVTLEGALFPLITGGRNIVELFKVQAELGTAFPLIEGTGRIYGMFVCTSVEETSKYLEANNAANRIDFTIAFKRDGDESFSLGGIVSSLVSLI